MFTIGFLGYLFFKYFLVKTEEYISYAKGVLGDAPFCFLEIKFNAY